MQIGLFSREGRYLVGRIGALVLSWDRHEGGRLNLAQVVDGDLVEVGQFSTYALVAAGAQFAFAATRSPLAPSMIWT